MRYTGSQEFVDWFNRVKATARGQGANSEDIEAWVQLKAALQFLEALDGVPIEESLTIRRVIRANRHPLWRVRPGGDARLQVQVRLIVWFRGDRVMIVYGGDKAGLQELWYEHAVATAEAIVDRELRRRHGGPG